MLAVVMLITMLPQTQLVNVNAAALTATASVPYLGHTTNPIKIGTKQQDEKWVQTVLKEGNKTHYVFCLDLGKTCRTGDTFSYNYTTGTDAWETYSSESTNETRALYAKIGHWYYNNGNFTKKRWIYAQALIWAVTEGETSKTELTNVIKALNDDPVIYGSTSYKSTKTAANLYSEIFDVNNVSIKVRTWVNENNNRQKLFEVVDETQAYNYLTLSKSSKYRQRVTVYKEDELGNPVQGADFTLAIKNVMELDDIKIGNGQESEEITDITGTSTFEMSGQTGQNGLIWWKITYSMESLEYGYVPAEDLQKMNDDEKAAVKAEMNNKGITYTDDLSQNGAEQLAERDLSYQFDRIKNRYELKETSSGNENLLVSEEYADGKEFILNATYSWGKVETTDGSKVWPESVDNSYYNYSRAYVIKPLVNDNKKYTVTVEKKDGYSEDGMPYGYATLQGARYQFFEDKECKTPATLFDAFGNKTDENMYLTDENGRFESLYLVAGKTYYLKDVKKYLTDYRLV